MLSKFKKKIYGKDIMTNRSSTGYNRFTVEGQRMVAGSVVVHGSTDSGGGSVISNKDTCINKLHENQILTIIIFDNYDQLNIFLNKSIPLYINLLIVCLFDNTIECFNNISIINSSYEHFLFDINHFILNSPYMFFHLLIIAEIIFNNNYCLNIMVINSFLNENYSNISLISLKNIDNYCNIIEKNHSFKLMNIKLNEVPNILLEETIIFKKNLLNTINIFLNSFNIICIYDFIINDIWINIYKNKDNIISLCHINTLHLIYEYKNMNKIIEYDNSYTKNKLNKERIKQIFLEKINLNNYDPELYINFNQNKNILYITSYDTDINILTEYILNTQLFGNNVFIFNIGEYSKLFSCINNTLSNINILHNLDSSIQFDFTMFFTNLINETIFNHLKYSYKILICYSNNFINYNILNMFDLLISNNTEYLEKIHINDLFNHKVRLLLINNLNFMSNDNKQYIKNISKLYYIIESQFINKIKNDLIFFTSLFRCDEFLINVCNNTNIASKYDFCSIIIFNIVNSNSKDTNDTLNRFKNNNNIYVYNTLLDPGLYECWNFCLNISDSKFVSNLNSDDIITDITIKEGYYILNNNNFGYYTPMYKEFADFNNYETVNRDLFETTQIYLIDNIETSKYTIYKLIKNNELNLEKIKIENKEFNIYSYLDLFKVEVPCGKITIIGENIPHSNPIWLKKLHTEFGYFYEDLYYGPADWDFHVRAMKLSGYLGFKSQIAYCYYYYNPKSYGRQTNFDPYIIWKKIFDHYI